MSNNCWICSATIDAANDTREHLIPNSIGGRKKVSGFICVSCNSNAGQKWDAELARQLQPLSTLFNVQRERGTVPPLRVETTAGEKLTIRPGEPLMHTHPEFKETPIPSGQRLLEIRARSIDEAKGMIKGLKKKYPQIDEDDLISQLKEVETYPEGVFHHKIQFGGAISGRSIVKSCAALAASLGIPPENCEFAVVYLRDPNANPCFGYYNETELVTGRTAGVPMNCLAVKADPADGLVLAYVEYFGAQRVVACLGEGYSGEPKNSVYCFDPRSGEELPVSVSLAFSKEDIDQIYNYRKISSEGMKTAFDAVVGPAVAESHKRERDRVLERAVEKAFASCGAEEGEPLTQEHMQKITDKVLEEITPHLMHSLRKRDGAN